MTYCQNLNVVALVLQIATKILQSGLDLGKKKKVWKKWEQNGRNNNCSHDQNEKKKAEGKKGIFSYNCFISKLWVLPAVKGTMSSVKNERTGQNDLLENREIWYFLSKYVRIHGDLCIKTYKQELVTISDKMLINDWHSLLRFGFVCSICKWNNVLMKITNWPESHSAAWHWQKPFLGWWHSHSCSWNYYLHAALMILQRKKKSLHFIIPEHSVRLTHFN